MSEDHKPANAGSDANSFASGGSGGAAGAGGAAARPRTRYGSRSNVPSGKLIVIGIVGVVVVSLAYILVQMNRVSSPDVEATPAGWAREEGREDEIFIFTLDVAREKPELDSYCVIYALNYNQAEVGRRDVFVPGGESDVVRIDVPIETRERAVAGNVYGCSTDLPVFLKQDS